MAEIPENEFNQLFRQAAETNQPPFDPKAWELMEKKLDREDRKAFWWRWGILLLIFISAALSFWYFSSSSDWANSQPKENKKHTSQPPFDSSKANKNTTKTTEKATIEASKKEAVTTLTEKNIAATKTDKLNSTGKTGISNSLEKEAKNSLNSNKGTTTDKPIGKNTSLPINTTKPFNKNNGISKEENEKKSVISPEDSTIHSDAGNAKSEEKKAIALLLEKTKLGQLENKLGNKIHLPTIQILQDSVQKPELPNRKWIIGLTLAPDLSGINFNGNKVGARTSLSLDYALSNRLYITTGLGVSNKRYLADSENYTVPAGYWVNGEKPINIDADCNVLELPIGLRYDWWAKNKKKLFLSTSISSFWMLKEVYDYTYEPSYIPQPDSQTDWVGRNKNKHLFSVWQLGIGYERAIGEKLFFQIEPFAQLPLAGIGFGKVDLTSFGTHFTLRYRLK